MLILSQCASLRPTSGVLCAQPITASGPRWPPLGRTSSRMKMGYAQGAPQPAWPSSPHPGAWARGPSSSHSGLFSVLFLGSLPLCIGGLHVGPCASELCRVPRSPAAPRTEPCLGSIFSGPAFPLPALRRMSWLRSFWSIFAQGLLCPVCGARGRL